MSPLACNAAEPIPGYFLRARIGTGGYGEVWRADAPGGLTKAIKFVYGYLNDERAANELKALSRIREVRHPFLLSLERIEVIDGQLVIVTELADESLKDRFETCRAAGRTGIPRDELLALLSDAADALDYMREQHSLQHLDVKPENLLLLGGHVKVADFGLVKDVYATGASLMGGMTPVYASPEVFDGRPSRHSDQYSLAIVFQEMLTGVPPFSGRTAAQLAKQHTSSPPRLTPLPVADQPIIAAALSKDPAARFPSCRALIDRLRQADPTRQVHASRVDGAGLADLEATAETTSIGSRETQPSPAEASAPRAPAEAELGAVKTVQLDAPDPSVSLSGARRRSGPPARRSTLRPIVQDLPPIEPAAGPVTIPPTVVLGIGGTGGRVLFHLRRRLHDRFGDLAGVPAIQMLLLDTDGQGLVQAARGDRGAALPERDTLAVPLRHPQEYRRDSPSLLTWLSRRWLYNIPRSLQTEGLRPLGRLAFADHAARILARIRQALAAATDPAAIAQSAEQTGAAFQADPPKVVIVASISGGTGSGMVLDVAYAVRKVLSELGLPDDGLCGLLTHSTSRCDQASNLAVTNAYACLGELYTYSHPNGFYPGDVDAELASTEGGTPTFNNTYLVHLGDNLSEAEFDVAVDSLADYLYLDAVTAGRILLDRCRRLARADAAATTRDIMLRTFGLRRIGYAHGAVIAEVANMLCRQVLAHWRGDYEPNDPRPHDAEPQARVLPRRLNREGPTAEEQKIGGLAGKQAAALLLDYKGITKQLYEVVGKQLGDNREAYFRALLQEFCEDSAAHGEEVRTLPTRAIRAIDSILGHSAGDCQEEPEYERPATPSLKTLLAEFVERNASHVAATLRHWFLQLTDRLDIRVLGAARTIRWFIEHLQAIEGQARGDLDQLEAQIVQTIRLIANTTSPKSVARRSRIRFGRLGQRKTEAARLLMQYAQSRLHTLVLRSVCRLTQSLQGSIARTAKQITDVQRELERLGEAFTMLASRTGVTRDGSGDSALDRIPAAVRRAIECRVPDLAAMLDAKFQQSYFDSRGGFSAVLTANLDHRARLPAALRDAARSVVRPVLREIDAAHLARPRSDGAELLAEHLQACVKKATPDLLRCGGAKRYLAVVPAGSSDTPLVEQIARHAGITPSLAFDADVDMALCCEVQGLSLVGVAAALVEGQPDLVEVAARLHTRSDVDWSRLDEVDAAPGDDVTRGQKSFVQSTLRAVPANDS